MDERRVLRWDYAWKNFLNPEMPWFHWFLEHLVGDRIKGIDLNNVATRVEAVDKEQRTTYDYRVADCFLKFSYDEHENFLHIEFESSSSDDIGVRTLMYALRKSLPAGAYSDGWEFYDLPQSFIVYVGNRIKESPEWRYVKLYSPDNDVILRFPVVLSQEQVPYISAIMLAESDVEINRAIIELMSELPPFDNSFVESEIFLRSCLLLNCDKAYSSAGVDEEEVVTMVNQQRDMRPAKVVWKEEGMQEGRREGMQEGMQEGMRRGAIIALKENVKSLLDAGFEEAAKKLCTDNNVTVEQLGLNPSGGYLKFGKVGE